MPARIGELPCYKAVTTRLDERDFEALTQAVNNLNTNQTEYIRRIIRQHLATNAESPAA
jgi:predicted DNA binding CopG/RHH family protein